MISRRTREVLVVAGLLAVVGFVLRASTKAPTELNWLDRLVLRGSAPVQGVLARGTGWFGEAWRRYVDLVDVKADNRRLVEENGQLRGELQAAKQEARRISELERLLALRATVPSESISARVVGVETSAYFRVARLRLDRGEGDVRPGMPVVVPAGIVGSVRRVYGAHADVLLATDPESSVDVIVSRSGAQATLKGVAGEYRYRARLLRTDDIKEGDEIVTSGYDGLFPRDLPVGKVVRVSAPPAGLWTEAEVAPAVDFVRLSVVLVVLAPPPPPDVEAGKRSPPPHRGLGTPR